MTSGNYERRDGVASGPDSWRGTGARRCGHESLNRDAAAARDAFAPSDDGEAEAATSVTAGVVAGATAAVFFVVAVLVSIGVGALALAIKAIRWAFS